MNCAYCGRRLVKLRDELGEQHAFDARDFFLSPREARARPRVYRMCNGVAELSAARVVEGRDGPFKRLHADVCEVRNRNRRQPRYVR